MTWPVTVFNFNTLIPVLVSNLILEWSATRRRATPFMDAPKDLIAAFLGQEFVRANIFGACNVRFMLRKISPANFEGAGAWRLCFEIRLFP